MPRARLWRFILLRQADGHWEMCQGLAGALQAKEVPHNEVALPVLPEGGGRGGPGRPSRSFSDAFAAAPAAAAPVDHKLHDKIAELGPLDFSLEALRKSVPIRLRSAAAEAEIAGRCAAACLIPTRKDGGGDPLRSAYALPPTNALPCLRSPPGLRSGPLVTLEARSAPPFLLRPRHPSTAFYAHGSLWMLLFASAALRLEARASLSSTGCNSRCRVYVFCARLCMHSGSVNVEHFWATLLAIGSLEQLEVSWLADEEEALTIVDTGNAWLAEKAHTMHIYYVCLAQRTHNSRSLLISSKRSVLNPPRTPKRYLRPQAVIIWGPLGREFSRASSTAAARSTSPGRRMGASGGTAMHARSKEERGGMEMSNKTVRTGVPGFPPALHAAARTFFAGSSRFLLASGG